MCGKIKKTLAVIGFMCVFLSSSAGQGAASYSFDRTSHDFGTIGRNENAQTVFTLTNSGTTPLIVLDVRVSCDCAKIEWPRQPIPPGGSATLTVSYKDRNAGTFYKQVEIVTSGTPRTTKIILKGTVG